MGIPSKGIKRKKILRWWCSVFVLGKERKFLLTMPWVSPLWDPSSPSTSTWEAGEWSDKARAGKSRSNYWAPTSHFTAKLYIYLSVEHVSMYFCGVAVLATTPPPLLKKGFREVIYIL